VDCLQYACHQDFTSCAANNAGIRRAIRFDARRDGYDKSANPAAARGRVAQSLRVSCDSYYTPSSRREVADSGACVQRNIRATATGEGDRPPAGLDTLSDTARHAQATPDRNGGIGS